MARAKFSHPADQHFEFLVDYLRHLVDDHMVEETPELWRSGRDTFDRLHAEKHGLEAPVVGGPDGGQEEGGSGG